MDDRGIVQKEEIVLVRQQWGRVRRKREQEITLLPDCFDSLRTPK